VPGLPNGGLWDMGIERRYFLKCASGTVAVLVAPIVWLAERTMPARFTEAIRTRCYPGPKKVLEEADVATPSRWKG